MGYSRSWAAALLIGTSMTSQSPFVVAQTPAFVEEELRQELREMRAKLERLEKRLAQQTGAAPSPTQEKKTAQPGAPAADPALQDRVDALDQQVRVLGRKQEIAQGEKAAKDIPAVIAGASGLDVRSADGQFELKFRGVVQTDGRFFLGDSVGTDTFFLRRVRPIFEGTLYGIYDFRIMPVFGGGKANVQDAYVDARFKPYAKLLVGKSKAPVGLERWQTDVDTRFVERAFPTDLTPNRDIGIELHGDLGNRLLEYEVGVFNGSVDGGSSEAFTNEQDNNIDKEYTARLFALPFRNVPGALQDLGLGIGMSYGNLGGSSPAAGLATIQQTSLPTYNTPAQQAFFSYRTAAPSATYANGQRLRWAPQAYWYYKSFGVLGEYVIVDQDVARNLSPAAAARAKLRNSAWQVQLSYLLTGEDESFYRIKPLRAFEIGKPGWGAFELVARYSELTVDPAAFSGGSNSFADPTVSAHNAVAWAVGLNWYLNSNIKAMFDYEQTRFT
ncbi:MAG: porin, partial [Betaproteobacteria bacterium]